MKSQTGWLILIVVLGYLLLKNPNLSSASYTKTPFGTAVNIPGVGTYASGGGYTTVNSPLLASLFTNLLNVLGKPPAAMNTQTPAPWYDPSTLGLPDAATTADGQAIIAVNDPYAVDTSAASDPSLTSPLITGDPLVASAYAPIVDSGSSLIGLVGA